MRTIIIIGLIILCAVALKQEAQARQIAGPQCHLTVPARWLPGGIEDDELVIQHSDYQSVRLTVRRYELEKKNQIGSEDDLRQAIAGLYRNLGIHQVTENDIDYSIEANRAIFGREYTNLESGDTCLMHYNLKGILVRRPDRCQVFYLLHAQAPDRIYNELGDDITGMMHSFEIAGKLSESLFPSGIDYGYFLLFLVMVALVFFFVRNKKIQRSRNPLGKNSQHYWRCPTCQLVNHVDSQSCQRCGAERVLQNTR